MTEVDDFTVQRMVTSFFVTAFPPVKLLRRYTLKTMTQDAKEGDFNKISSMYQVVQSHNFIANDTGYSLKMRLNKSSRARFYVLGSP